jgi:hypothetical protein
MCEEVERALDGNKQFLLYPRTQKFHDSTCVCVEVRRHKQERSSLKAWLK